ncbi:MAG: HEAT repeat domain-containing protein [Acidobacteria bacterium]|nr:HEAT repeat domain-containing protein [Acidobacteriota bacterium]
MQNQQTNPTQQQPGGPPAQQPARLRPSGPVFPPEFQADRYLKMDESQLLEVLKAADSSVFAKNVACRQLALIGTKQSVPVLAAMLTDEKLSHYARYAIKPIPDASVDDALRATLPKVKGKLLCGMLDTIGHRGDTRAIEPVSRLIFSPDTEVAQAAAASLGQISGPAAAKALLDALPKTRGAVRHAVADSCLVCAEGLIAQGDTKQAVAMYDTLARPEMPKTVRDAAMHSLIVHKRW